MHVREQVESDRGKCLDKVCPYVGVSVDGGDRSEVDCSERFYAKYGKTTVLVSSQQFRMNLNQTTWCIRHDLCLHEAVTSIVVSLIPA